MRRFSQLFAEIGQTNRTIEKVSVLENYFRSVPPADAAWALEFLSGRTLPRAVNTRLLRDWATAETGIPLWLFDECHDSVGDLAETLALIMPHSGPGTDISLSALVHDRLLPLRQLPENGRRSLLIETWRELNSLQRLVFNKLIVGSFRIGVSRTLVLRALATIASVEPAVMAHRVAGRWQPTAADFLHLLRPSGDAPEAARPYPFFLASPIEIKVDANTDFQTALGSVADWQVEWKWDGIRAQIIRRGDERLIWSRGDEMVTESFPELAAAARGLPPGCVLDGEIVAWRPPTPSQRDQVGTTSTSSHTFPRGTQSSPRRRVEPVPTIFNLAGTPPCDVPARVQSAESPDPCVQPFARLQRRLGRKTLTGKIQQDFPVAFLAYDLLELAGQDIRSWPLRDRRSKLEELLRNLPTLPPPQPDHSDPQLPMLFDVPPTGSAQSEPLIHPSPILQPDSWEELRIRIQEARARGVEGLMLKRRESAYGVGRQRGDWWKWKIEPYLIDAVLIYAQRGHGRRAGIYTDYTFGLWKQSGELVPIAKAYSGLTDAEIEEVDTFIRQNTLETTGPVRKVRAELVFELAFEGIQASQRHKAGLAVRFPRIHRWRRDKKPFEADTLVTLGALLQQQK